MKKINSTLILSLVAFFTLFGYSCGNANDGQKAVDALCDIFDDMAGEVKKCKSLDDLEKIDFDRVVEKSDLYDMPDSSLNYKLTSEDKKKIKKAADNFIDEIVDKTADLSGGPSMKPYIEEAMKPYFNQIHKAIDNAKTLNDLGEEFKNI